MSPAGSSGRVDRGEAATGGEHVEFQEYFDRKMFPQVKELMAQDREAGLIWFDVPGVSFSDEQARKIVEMMHEAQPGILVNGRLGKQQYVDHLVSGDNEAAGSNVNPGRGRR